MSTEKSGVGNLGAGNLDILCETAVTVTIEIYKY